MPPSLLVLRYLVEDWLPRLLLPVNERPGFGGRHRIRVTAEWCELLLQFRIERNFPQVLADLVDDCFGRAYGRHQNSPTSGLETGNRFRHCGNVGEFRRIETPRDGETAINIGFSATNPIGKKFCGTWIGTPLASRRGSAHRRQSARPHPGCCQ